MRHGKVQVLAPTQEHAPRYGTSGVAKSAQRSATVATLRSGAHSNGPPRPTGTPRTTVRDRRELLDYARNKERALERARHKLSRADILMEEMRIAIMRRNAGSLR